jgi:hypothetical protein
MSVYGLKVSDTSGNVCVLTPNVKNIISSGTLSLPTTLRNTGTAGEYTFGCDVALPGTTAFDEGSIGVLVSVNTLSSDFPLIYTAPSWSWGQSPNYWSYLRLQYYGATFFNRSSAGIFTEFTEEQYKDSLYNYHTVAFWEKLGQTSFTFIRLFAGVVFYIFDSSTGTYKQIWYLAAIKSIDYVIYLKNI